MDLVGPGHGMRDAVGADQFTDHFKDVATHGEVGISRHAVTLEGHLHRRQRPLRRLTRPARQRPDRSGENGDNTGELHARVPR